MNSQFHIVSESEIETPHSGSIKYTIEYSIKFFLSGKKGKILTTYSYYIDISMHASSIFWPLFWPKLILFLNFLFASKIDKTIVSE